jgi:hypothetical protein
MYATGRWWPFHGRLHDCVCAWRSCWLLNLVVLLLLLLLAGENDIMSVASDIEEEVSMAK